MLLLVVGIGVLTVGADVLVRGASTLALRMGIAPLVIGLTVVAVGTSLPEIAVSAGAALLGQGEVALGNAVGSNIFNILVVLGGAAIIRPLLVDRQLVRFDVPVMIAVAALVPIASFDGTLGRMDGIVLLGLGVAYVFVLLRMGDPPGEATPTVVAEATVEPLRSAPDGDQAAPVTAAADDGSAASADPAGAPSPLRALLQILGGAVLLVVGARLLVSGASEVARSLGASELVVGLTVVAAGTSLPELATSYMAAARGQRDIAVGNVVGSNIFNVLLVLGSAGLLSPSGIEVPSGVMTFDLPVMLGASLACLPIFFTGLTVSRVEGVIFCFFYVAYLTYLFLHLADHAADDVVRVAVLWFAGPLATVTLGLSAGREWWRRQRG